MTTYVGVTTTGAPAFDGSVSGSSSSTLVVRALATGYYAIYGQTGGGGAAGVYGYNIATTGGAIGVAAATEDISGAGIYCRGKGVGDALWCDGFMTVSGPTNLLDTSVSGNFAVFGGTKSFVIDHPLDPENRELAHACVESPDRKNIYDGVGFADSEGELVVNLPLYFDALNAELRYQLTPVGGAAPNLHVKDEVQDGQFTIGGALASQKVCWQITGNRHDPTALAIGFEPERDKALEDRGRFHCPEAFGRPPEDGIHFERRDRPILGALP